MKLSELVRVWEILHQKDTGEVGFSDLVDAVDKVEFVVNDLNVCQPSLGSNP